MVVLWSFTDARERARLSRRREREGRRRETRHEVFEINRGITLKINYVSKFFMMFKVQRFCDCGTLIMIACLFLRRARCRERKKK